jgi:hypothetical protein
VSTALVPICGLAAARSAEFVAQLSLSVKCPYRTVNWSYKLSILLKGKV